MEFRLLSIKSILMFYYEEYDKSQVILLKLSLREVLQWKFT